MDCVIDSGSELISRWSDGAPQAKNFLDYTLASVIYSWGLGPMGRESKLGGH